MTEQSNDKKLRPGSRIRSFRWLGIGVALGAGVGVAMDNIPIGAGLGITIGALISIANYMYNKKNQSGDGDLE